MKNLKNAFKGYRKIVLPLAGLLVLAVALIPSVLKTDVLAGQDAMSNAKAKEIAFADAGVASDKAQNLKIKYDRENGKFIYEVDFVANDNKYEYDISADSGAIVKKDIEAIKPTKPTHEAKVNATTQSTKQQQVKQQQTKSQVVAPNKANTQQSNNTQQVKTQQVKPQLHAPNNTNTQQSKPNQSSLISMERAKQIALNNAGVSATQCRGIEIDRDYEYGVLVYEVGFECGNYEYDFDIDASTGAIVHKDVEYDD